MLEVTTRCVMFVERTGTRFVSPVFTGDVTELGSEFCDIPWEQALAKFSLAKTYPEFVKASVEVQGHYREFYQYDTLCAKANHQARAKELSPEVDELYIVRARQYDGGKRADRHRLSELVSIVSEREELIGKLDVLCAGPYAGADAKHPSSAAFSAFQTGMKRRIADITAVFDAICSELRDSNPELFAADYADLYSISMVAAHVDAKGCLRQTVEGKPFDFPTSFLATEKEEVYAGFPYFVKMDGDTGSDAPNGTIYIPRDNKMTAFFVIPVNS